MSNAAPLGAVEFEVEASWGVDTTTFGTTLSCIGEPSHTMAWDKEAAGRLEEYRTGGEPPVLMTQGGTFTTKHDLVRGATTVGTPSASPLGTLLGYVLGNTAFSLTTSQTATGGTAAVPTMSGATGVVAGGLVRVGALGDGDGNGQMYAAATHSGSDLTLIGALDDAPANGAVVAGTEMAYPYSAATATDITGLRFRFLSGNLGYEAHGCFATGYEITGINTGERPQITITWSVSWWRHTATTLPSSNAAAHYNPSPIAAGSFNFQTVGTTTRAKYAIRGLTVSHTLNVAPQMAPGGVNAYQKITGAKRAGHDTVTMSFTVDADAATATPAWHTLAIGAGVYHCEWTGSTTAGSALGFKMPRVCITNVPVQKNDGGINRLTIECAAYSGATVTSELTRAAIVWGLG